MVLFGFSVGGITVPVETLMTKLVVWVTTLVIAGATLQCRLLPWLLECLSELLPRSFRSSQWVQLFAGTFYVLIGESFPTRARRRVSLVGSCQSGALLHGNTLLCGSTRSDAQTQAKQPSLWLDHRYGGDLLRTPLAVSLGWA